MQGGVAVVGRQLNEFIPIPGGLPGEEHIGYVMVEGVTVK